MRLLTKEAPLYRSSAEAMPPVRLLKPNPGNRAIKETKPIFEWEASGETDTYEIKLMRISTGKDSGSEQPVDLTDQLNISEQQAQLKEGISLQPGSTYTLQIKPILKTDDDLTLPAQLESTYTFYVLTAQEAQQLQWAEANRSKAPLSSMMILYRLQRYADAAQLANDRHQNKQLKPWMEAIQARLQQRLTHPGE